MHKRQAGAVEQVVEAWELGARVGSESLVQAAEECVPRCLGGLLEEGGMSREDLCQIIRNEMHRWGAG